MKLNRMLKNINMAPMYRNLFKRRKNNTSLLLSLIGVSIAGGATAYTLSRKKNREMISDLMKKIIKQDGTQMVNS